MKVLVKNGLNNKVELHEISKGEVIKIGNNTYSYEALEDTTLEDIMFSFSEVNFVITNGIDFNYVLPRLDALYCVIGDDKTDDEIKRQSDIVEDEFITLNNLIKEQAMRVINEAYGTITFSDSDFVN